MNSDAKFKNLIVWQKSHTFVLHIYQLTRKFPNEEMFGLVSQIRRAAVSIPANICEGQARQSLKEFTQFLFIAKGSLAEVEYYLILANDLGYITLNDYSGVDYERREIGKLLTGFINKVKLS